MDSRQPDVSIDTFEQFNPYFCENARWSNLVEKTRVSNLLPYSLCAGVITLCGILVAILGHRDQGLQTIDPRPLRLRCMVNGMHLQA